MSRECGAPTLSGQPCKRRGACPIHTPRENANECAVCLTPLSGPCRTLPCNHEFHRRCISTWTRRGHNTCPLCRAPYAERQPEYKVTITVENVRNANVYTHLSNTIPEFVSRMNILTPDTLITEFLIDVDSRNTLTALLSDFGIQSIPENV